MPNFDITQLELLEAKDISSNDMFIGAVNNSSEQFNYSATSDVLSDYIKFYSQNTFPISFKKDIDYNNVNSSVYLQNKDFSKIQSITFDDYGNIISFNEKTPVKNRIDKFNFPIATQQKNSSTGKGYFDRNSKLKQTDKSDYIFFKTPEINKVSSEGGKSVIRLSDLFDISYTNYTKTIITMRMGRGDVSGSGESASVFNFYIDWGTQSYVKGNALIYPNGNAGTTQPLIWGYQEIKDGGNKPFENFFYNDSGRFNPVKNFQCVIEIDNSNKRINKLPLPVWGPGSNRQTHSVTLTIESFD